MSTLKPHQIEEVNELITKIQKSIKPKCEIGAQNRNILKAQLSVHKIKKKTMFFKCKPEYSDEIVNYFVNEKKVARNRFHMNSRDEIYLLF